MDKLKGALAAAAAATALGACAIPSAGAASTSVLCVGGKPTCFSTVQAAIDAAADGDRIEIAPGTYAGGITIDKSVELTGASAASTVNSGGGPVITVGGILGSNQDLNVVIEQVTITGGLNDSQPAPAVVAGGGVWIPQSAGPAPGATVTISHSIVTGNRVTPGGTIPKGGFSC